MKIEKYLEVFRLFTNPCYEEENQMIATKLTQLQVMAWSPSHMNGVQMIADEKRMKTMTKVTMVVGPTDVVSTHQIFL